MRAIAGKIIAVAIILIVTSIPSFGGGIDPQEVLSALYDYCQDISELESKFNRFGRLTWQEHARYADTLKFIDSLVEVYRIITTRRISCHQLTVVEAGPLEIITKKTPESSEKP